MESGGRNNLIALAQYVPAVEDVSERARKSLLAEQFRYQRWDSWRVAVRCNAAVTALAKPVKY
jgi:hypothetical protein